MEKIPVDLSEERIPVTMHVDQLSMWRWDAVVCDSYKGVMSILDNMAIGELSIAIILHGWKNKDGQYIRSKWSWRQIPTLECSLLNFAKRAADVWNKTIIVEKLNTACTHEEMVALLKPVWEQIFSMDFEYCKSTGEHLLPLNQQARYFGNVEASNA